LERPPANPTIKFKIIESQKIEQIEDYSILAVPVNHPVPAVGYQITSHEGKKIFYTGDTGTGLAECWTHVSPHLLFMEVTAPNRHEEFAKESGHLTPNMLKQELTSFQKLKGYLPKVILVHLNPYLEKEIEAEVAEVAEALDNSITLAREGMRLRL
jgi:ribonuclease BN (tRNA processing enzyme)